MILNVVLMIVIKWNTKKNEKVDQLMNTFQFKLNKNCKKLHESFVFIVEDLKYIAFT